MTGEHAPLLIAIVGPTAVGKTGLAIELALRIGGEVVSADSRQIYKGMNIGTAKPTVAELARVRHHLIDIRQPDEWMTLAKYQALANESITDIHERSKIPLLVGGTGQYVNAVVQGWKIPHVPPNDEIRRKLESRAEATGHLALHAELARVDANAAASIDSRNVRRVIRALEVYYVTGSPISALQGRQSPPFDVLLIGLTRPRGKLYELIDQRIDNMVRFGLAEEVRNLVDAGYDWSTPAMSSLGYRQLRDHITGDTTLEDCVSRIKHDTRVFVRMQYNWFKLTDKSIHWIDLNEYSMVQAVGEIQQEMSNRQQN